MIEDELLFRGGRGRAFEERVLLDVLDQLGLSATVADVFGPL